MLSLVSETKMSITMWLSSPSALQTEPISFAKPTFSAWNPLSTYLVISATRIGTR